MKRARRGIPMAAAALAICVLIAHAQVSLTSGYDVNLVSGVWLALAGDLRGGLFYRDLIGAAGYGGTRYFPLFFGLIVAFMRLGLDPVAAGQAASFTGAGVLATGAFALLTRFGLTRSAAIPVAVLATAAPYFVQQTVFAIRVEPLAAGLALWGLVAVCAAMRRASGSWSAMAAAALCFTCAIAAKPTSAFAPAAALLALALARRRTDAMRLGLLTVAGVLLLIFGVDWLSHGRFLVSVRATALAGETPGALVSPNLVVRPIALIGASRFLTAVFLLTSAALVATRSRWRDLPILLLVTAAGETALALATPGTILTNQILELYVIAVLFLGWFCYTRQGVTRAGSAVLAALLCWTAAQDLTRIADIRRTAREPLAVRRQALVDALRSCEGTVLAESPLVPILAGRSPELLDPFAFRVVAARLPAVASHLISRLSQQQFGCVVLEQNPEEPRGIGWYRNVHFGWPVIDAVLRHYEYYATIDGHRFYRPRP